MRPKRQEVEDFQAIVWRYYDQHGRHDLPWRVPEPGGNFDPYKIMVSEIMLQQTQVGRVLPKYEEFLRAFPVLKALAEAELGDVLRQWSGLGYNRRAKFLWLAARKITEESGGVMPHAAEELKTLPGIGPNTAAAVAVYSYNAPEVFIETNIRTVYIHHFFQDRADIPDREILELVRLTLPMDDSREWYWALMDYGTYLKAAVGNLNRASKHYAKQSRFEGSKRQLRGQVLRLLAVRPQSPRQLRVAIKDDRLDEVLAELTSEQMIRLIGDTFYL
jgi:A/G-specific adenine glycosylase